MTIVTTGGEKDARRFFEEWPVFLLGGYLNSRCDFIASEWTTGTGQRVDFVIVESISTIVKIHLIELESPTDKLYVRESKPKVGNPSPTFRTMSKNLRVAIDQIAAYTNWIVENPWPFRQSLVQRAEEALPLKVSSSLLDHQVKLHINGIVVIGNRSLEDIAAREHRAAFNQSGGVEIAPFDRILDFLDRIENAHSADYWEDFNNQVKRYGFLRRVT